MVNYRRYSEELKKEVIRPLGRTKKSLNEECKTVPKLKEEYGAYKTHQALLKEIAELKKENDFLKKAAATGRL